MNVLNRKLFRDLLKIKGQVLAIAVVIACGVAAFVLSVTTHEALTDTQQDFYREYRFANMFAALKRAPDSVARRIAELPGVDQVETRIQSFVNMRLASFDEPITGLIMSLPAGRQPKLNRLYLRKGRLVEAGRDDEVVVSDAFADAHKLKLGERIAAVINGRYRDLRVVGIALSPEYVYQLRPGDFIPDFKRYAVVWMEQQALAKAYNMEGAFNSLSLTYRHGINPQDLIKHIDLILERYGGRGAYARKDQVSHRYLSEEFKQLEQMAFVYPVIFFSVSIFLLNIVANRLVGNQREIIATMKAFGYGNWTIGLHYFYFITIIVLFGVVVGIALGLYFGRGLSNMYMEYYRFPRLIYLPSTTVYVWAFLINMGGALLGSFIAAKKAFSLPPAEGMREQSPALYRKSFAETLGIGRWLSQPSRIIVRNIERSPVKSFFSVVGIGLSCSIMIVGGYFIDAIKYIIQVQYNVAQKEDISVAFNENINRTALSSIKGVTGIEMAEGSRRVTVKIRKDQREETVPIQGIVPDTRLKVLLDTNLKPFKVNDNGIILTRFLARKLDIKRGDLVEIEFLDGKRRKRQVPVIRLVKEYLGMSGYMSLDRLNRISGDGDVINEARILVKPGQLKSVYASLDRMPRVMGVISRRTSMKNFYATLAETIFMFSTFMVLFASTIALGVVYNSARILLSERSHELASLRVLGFRKSEVSFILLGEIGVITLAAIPLGLLFGYGLCHYFAASFQNELYRVPLLVDPSTYARAAAYVVIAALVSGLLVRQRLDHLDLVSVLKTKD